MPIEPPILTGAPPYSNQPPNITSDSISTITIPNVRLCENNEKRTKKTIEKLKTVAGRVLNQ